MKLSIICLFIFIATGMFAQEHFSGINTSRRTGLLNASLNPAELVNLANEYEINVLNISANISNNKITFGDLVSSDENFEDLLFRGSEAVNLRLDADIVGPGFGFKYEKWGFAITSSAKVKANMVNVDTDLGNALTDNTISPLLGVSLISSSENQRASATTWGEIGLSAARELYNDGTNKLSAGVTFNLLFPGSFANMSASNFQGSIRNEGAQLYLTDAQANLNFAYSGSLGDDFTDSSNFTKFFAGGLNGFSTDIGVNYQWLDNQKEDGYMINAGLSVKNLGSMTFKDDNNVSNNYTLDITGTERLNLNQFEDVETIDDVEQLLLQSGYATLQKTRNDFKVKLPSILAMYADVKVHNNWYVTGYLQQKLQDDEDNTQIAQQNIFTVTPRYSTKTFEAYLPLSHNEIAGFTAGIGVRVGGFFIGSGSVLSAAVTDTNQADAYIGYRIGF
jgi:hypothetical protein